MSFNNKKTETHKHHVIFLRLNAVDFMKFDWGHPEMKKKKISTINRHWSKLIFRIDRMCMAHIFGWIFDVHCVFDRLFGCFRLAGTIASTSAPVKQLRSMMTHPSDHIRVRSFDARGRELIVCMRFRIKWIYCPRSIRWWKLILLLLSAVSSLFFRLLPIPPRLYAFDCWFRTRHWCV